MNERDELIEILHQTATADRVKDNALSRTPVVAAKVAAVADAILAAGYSKPRTITTAEELDALPKRSVIMTDDEVCYQLVDGHYHRYPLPATVLYEPTP